MAIDKKLQIFDDEGNPVDYDILASDVKFLPDGKDLPTKLAEMEEEIGEGGYTPPQGGIPKTDLAPSVQQTLDDVANKVDKVPGKGLSTNDYTDADKYKLGNLPTADQLTQQLGGKANDTQVVKSISVNGTAQSKDTNGNVNIEVSGGSQVTVTTNNDGTFTIHAGDNDYTINLNHTHENMAKLRIVDEEPSDPALDTIYALVDNVTRPGEILSLYIAGLEFVGGGGSSEPDTTPKLSSPKNNATLDFSGAQSTTLVVKGKNLTSPLSVTATGDFTVTANGSSVSSIAATDANDGITLTLTKGNGFDENGGSLTIEGLLDDVAATINVIDSKILPGGLVADTAWNRANQVGSNAEAFSAPGFQSGYCTTPFYKVTYNGNLMQLFIKAGYVSNTQGTGDLPHAFDVFKHADTDAATDGAYHHANDPQERKSVNDPNKVHQWVSSTFKTSEIANCYIYDNVAGKYLFPTESMVENGLTNVDTSVAPNV